MDRLEEQIDLKTGRKIYRYFEADGSEGKIVSRREHLIDLKNRGKIANVDIDSISFKRKRPVSHSASTVVIDRSQGDYLSKCANVGDGLASNEYRDSTVISKLPIDTESNKNQSRKLCNELNKKHMTLEAVHIGDDKKDIIETSKLLEKLRITEVDKCAYLDPGIRNDLVAALTKSSLCTYEQLASMLVKSPEMRELFSDDLAQEHSPTQVSRMF